MHTVQEKRTSAEQSISQTSQQKRDFEARLAQARAMYEQEVANFKALEERLRVSKAETTKLQQEYALIEGSRQDLQNQYTQVSTALAADQQENASLKEKIRQANAEVAQLKPALEKARSDARQQKGLVAINKKQLATVEGERDKIQGEIDTLAKETPSTLRLPPRLAPLLRWLALLFLLQARTPTHSSAGPQLEAQASVLCLLRLPPISKRPSITSLASPLQLLLPLGLLPPHSAPSRRWLPPSRL